MNELRTFGVFLFYGLLIAVLAWAAYRTTVFGAQVGKELGALLGGLVGVLISIGLWYWMGKKYVEEG